VFCTADEDIFNENYASLALHGTAAYMHGRKEQLKKKDEKKEDKKKICLCSKSKCFTFVCFCTFKAYAIQDCFS
jgi:hypothetical protein